MRVGHRWRRRGDARAVGCSKTGTGSSLDWWRQSNRQARWRHGSGGVLNRGTGGVCFLGLLAGGVEGLGGVLVSLWGLSVLILGGGFFAIWPGPAKNGVEELFLLLARG